MGAINATAIHEAILGQGDKAWHKDDYRRESYDVHKHTKSIVLVFTNKEARPNAEVCIEPSWNRPAD